MHAALGRHYQRSAALDRLDSHKQGLSKRAPY